MINAAFDASGVCSLAFAVFHEIYDEIKAIPGKEERIEYLINYANKRGKIEDILRYVENENPYQYKSFESKLVDYHQLLSNFSFYIPKESSSFNTSGIPVQNTLENTESENQNASLYDESATNGNDKHWFFYIIAIIAAVVLFNFITGDDTLVMREIVVDHLSSKLYVATNYGVLKVDFTTKETESYVLPPQLTSNEESQTIFAVSGGDFTSLYLGDNNGQLHRTDDGGIHWSNPLYIGKNTSIFSIAVIDDGNTSVIFAATPEGIYRKRSNDVWELSPSFAWSAPFDSLKLVNYPNASNILFALGTKNIFYTQDFGDKWEAIPLPVDLQGNNENTSLTSITIDTSGNPNLIYLATTSGFFKTQVNAVNWSSTGLRGIKCNTLLFVPANPRNLLYVATDRGIFKSEDGGDTWTSNISLRQYDIRVLGIHPQNPNILFAGTSEGLIYISQDRGQNWDIITTVRKGLSPTPTTVDISPR